MKKKLYIKTYGCQANIYDSIKMNDLLEQQGYAKTDMPDDADIIVLNTCNIREKAAEKTYSELGRIRKIKDKRKQNGHHTIVAVAGCVSQAEGDLIFKRAPIVDIVVGPQSFFNIPKMIDDIYNGAKNVIDLDFKTSTKFEVLPEESLSQGVSAYVTIQEGCDKFCTFCSVPYTRGPEYSRSFSEIYRETMHLVRNGAKEIILLGQNVNAYHGMTPEGEINLQKLIKELAKISGIERIRYTTSHPNNMDESLERLHGDEIKLMPLLHLPVQSGSDKVLALMNRKHTANKYFEIIDRLRQNRPDIAFSSDFIVGFPGEEDEDFEKTIELIERVNFASAYSFKYSPRPGTPAADKIQIDEDVKDKRLQKLQALLIQQQKAFNESFVGKSLDILFDKKGRHAGQIIGKSPYMQSVTVLADERYMNQIVRVKITDNLAYSLFGVIE